MCQTIINGGSVMIFDMHVHQNRHSSDSRLDIYEGIQYAKNLGLDGICITDHDDLGLRSLAKELSENAGIQVIVGVEIYTLDGDLLCYGIEDLPKERMTAQETIDYVNERGGACIAAHPYRSNRRGLEEVLYDVKGLSAIEGYNGRTKSDENHKAISVATELDIPISGGSDAHTLDEIGNYVTVFQEVVYDEQSFVKALKSGSFYPSILEKPISNKEIA